MSSAEVKRDRTFEKARALQESEGVFRLLVASVIDYAIFLLDPRGYVATWNAGAERIKGYSAPEIIGEHFSRFYPEEDVRAGKCDLEIEIATREGRFEEEGWRIRKDGSRFWASVVITAVRDDSGALVAFAKVTRDLTERRRAEEIRLEAAQRSADQSATERSLARITRLQLLTGRVAATRTPEELAAVVVGDGVDALGAATGIFVRPDGDELAIVASRGLLPSILPSHHRFPLDARRSTAVAFRTGQSEWIEDGDEYARRYPEGPLDLVATTMALVVLPLKVGDDVRGVMAFRFDRPRTFAPDERSIMETFAVQAGQALDRADIFAREVAARRRLEALGTIAEALSIALTTCDVARVVVDKGMLIAGADTCTLYALDERTGSLDLIGEHGCDARIIEQIRHIAPESTNPVRGTVTTRAAIWAETEAEYLAFYPALATMKVDGPRARAFWSVPLIAEGVVIGLLGMGFYAEHRFPIEEREFVQTFTRHCAQALLRARRHEAERTARTDAENLQASLSTTLRSIGDAVIATDAGGKVTLMNPVAEGLTGWTEAAAHGRRLHDLFQIIDQQTRAAVPSPVDQVIEHGRVVGLSDHALLVAPDGRETPIDHSGAPIRRNGGPTEGVVLVFRDVGEKKRDESRKAFLADATAALSDSLDSVATLTRVARLAVPRLADWCSVDLVDPDTRVSKQVAVAHVDPAKVEYARDLGIKYPPDPSAPTGVPNVLRTGRSELYPEISDEMLQAGCVDAEHLRIARDLRLRSALVVPLTARGRILGAMSLIYAESGRTYTNDDLVFAEDLARRCATAIDNAQLYAAEQRAREAADGASLAKDEFLAAVSHELRTPLNAILGWSRMLTGLEESKRAKATETIERNAVAMAQLIEDLLDISRIVSGKMRLDVGSVDLAPVAEAAVTSISPAADAKGITIVETLDRTTGPVVGDAARLQQIVWNLLSNAVKFTPRGGRVSVVLRHDESCMEITVSDTGIGIEPRFLPHVFEPFRQADGGISRSTGGLGLGLAITRQLVELHGGSIVVTSDGIGKGSTFTLTLPAPTTAAGQRTRDRISPVAPPGFGSQPDLQGQRILVVDDDDDARGLLQAILEQCGATVTTADGVAAAMRVFEESPPDLLLSDIGMPGESGFDLIRRVRALPPERGGNVPAAALTAYARAEDRREVVAAGYLMHVPKPLDPEELVAVVAALARFRAGDTKTR